MCGIVGAVGQSDVVPKLLDGMRRLEYRGYDSGGIGVLAQGAIERRRAVGKIEELVSILRADPIAGNIGVGHTRWATHGAPAPRNAHPQCSAAVAVVHNGIIENYESLRTELEAGGYVFESETDTEVIPALITVNLRSGMTPREAISSALQRLEGVFAVAIMLAGHEQQLYGARRGAPLVVGHGDGEMYLASDVAALIPYTRRFTFLEEGDWTEITREGVIIFDASGAIVKRPLVISERSSGETEKGHFRHYMLKEIFDQPVAVRRTVASYVNRNEHRVTFPWLPIDAKRITRISIPATGASRHAGTVAKYVIERLARIPVDVDAASEFAYRDPVFTEDGVVLAISQSGETADTLRAVRLAKQHHQPVVSIINVPESSLGRESDLVLPTLAGAEIGIAATKSFTAQLVVLTILAIGLARQRGEMGRATEQILYGELLELPTRIESALSLGPAMETLAARLAKSRALIVLGRGVLYPIAEAGALMISEVAYINAMAHPAGELKHGPLALIDQDMPVIALACQGNTLEKLKANLMEVRARGGRLIVISDDASEIDAIAPAEIVRMPFPIDEFTAPFVFTVALQLLAYHLAVGRGTDVDRPRNLAKSVTVE